MSKSVEIRIDRLDLIVAGVGAFLIYLAVAWYMESSYADPRPTGSKVRLLSPPFERVGDHVVKYGVKADPGTVVIEGKRDRLEPITPNYRGPGTFEILPNGVTFSSTDGTDPNKSGRQYWLVVP